VLRTVPVANVGQTLTELELTLEVASEVCPHCGSVNLFPGFSRMLGFTCRQCGKAVLRPGSWSSRPCRCGTRPTEVRHGDSASECQPSRPEP
jgi:Zn finger protein HypA/HybF involved in hydrogenase expression